MVVSPSAIADMNSHILREDTKSDPQLWALKYRVNPKDPDLPFTFKRTVQVNKLGIQREIPMRYLDDIYGVLTDLKDLYCVVKKGRQARISEWLVNATFYCCDWYKGITILYILQTEDVGKDFCKRRIDDAVDSSQYLSDLIVEGGKRRTGKKKVINSLSIKKFLHSWFYMVHSRSGASSRSPSSDIVIFDEYDEHCLDHETSFRSTMDDSDIQALLYVSTPTLPEFGIDRKFKSTSMGVWTQNCSTCLEDFVMDSVYFFGGGVKVLDERRISDGALRVFICPHCGAEMKQWEKQERGRYVHKFPELLRENRIGLSFSNLILPHITADKAQKQYRECLLEPGGRKTYVNEKLGEACVSEETSVYFTRDMLQNECCDRNVGWVSAALGTYIGVDWGKDTHVSVWSIIPTGIQLLNLFEFKHDPEPLANAKKVVNLVALYNPKKVVCDFGAGQEQNKYVAQRVKDAFWVAVESVSLKNLEPIWNEKTQFVKYDVVTAYTVFASWCAAGMVKLPKYDEKVEVFINHCLNSVLLDLNELPAEEQAVQHLHKVEQLKPKVLGKKGPIHFLSSALFAFLHMIGNEDNEFLFSDIPDDFEVNDDFNSDDVKFTLFNEEKGSQTWVP